jgi:hypothetical protein
MAKNIGIYLFFVVLFGSFGVVSLSPVSVMAATTTATTPAKSTDVSTTSTAEIQNIQKIIGEKTPSWISGPIINTINFLEEFRKTKFNTPLIFYAVLIIILILVLRFIFRLIF